MPLVGAAGFGAFFYVFGHLIKQNCFLPNQRRLVPLNKARRGWGWWALFKGTSCLRFGEETVKKKKEFVSLVMICLLHYFCHSANSIPPPPSPNLPIVMS